MPAGARWAALVLATLLVLGARLYFGGESGVVTAAIDDEQARQAAAMLSSLGAPTLPAPGDLPAGRPAAELRAEAPSLTAGETVASAGGLVLAQAPFVERDAGAGAFTRLEGAEMGFEQLPLPRLYQTMQPVVNQSAPLAAGDVNGDGWPDVLVGSSHGVLLYANTGGRFALQEIDFPMRGWRVTYVALVDLDGSGAPDLFFCAWMQDCHVLYNRGGGFSAAAHTALPRGEEPAVQSAAFGDIDRDGRVDVVTGPIAGLGWNFSQQHNVRVWRNEGEGRFRDQQLEGPGGETLSLLFVDADGDGWADLYVGNDFDEPDLLYRNDEGRLRLTTAEENPFPHGTESTMSVDSGDLTNDGELEVYVAAIAYGGISDDELQRRRRDPHVSCQQAISAPADLDRCLELAEFQTAVSRSRDITDVRECAHFPDVRQRDCIAAGYLWNEAFVTLPSKGATWEAVADQCTRVPEDFETFHDVCAGVPDTPLDHGQAGQVVGDQPPLVGNRNVLFASGGDAAYDDVTEQWGAAFGGWSWNAKFADLDNDTWQDLFIAQGTRLRFRNTSNLLYRNDAGTGFTDRTGEFGLRDHVPTGGSLFVDYDLDGRLDLITYPFDLTPVVWRNEVASPNSFQVALRDHSSPNTEALGARVEIRSPDGRRQVREIKGSGGYLSDDWKVARFGLGDWTGVAELTLTWPDGTVDTLPVDSLGPGRYTLERAGGGGG